MVFKTKDGEIDVRENGATWIGETANSVRSIFDGMSYADIADALQHPLLRAKLQAKGIIISIA